MELARAEIDQLLAGPRTAVVATLRRDGAPHLTTVWYRWDGASFWISMNRTTAKYRHLRRDPRVALLVDNPPDETSVAAYGPAEVIARDEAAWPGTLAIVSRYVDDSEAYLEARRSEPRVLIRITPHNLVSWKP